MSIYVRTSDDGRYGLTGPDPYGYCHLYRIVEPDPEDPEHVDFSVGLVSNPENFESVIDVAEEEARFLIEQAREEFGS